MSSYDDYDDDFDPFSGDDYARMASPQSDWSELETPAGDDVDEGIDSAGEGDPMTPVIDPVVKSKGGSP
jgi:hypothetical protein